MPQYGANRSVGVTGGPALAVQSSTAATPSVPVAAVQVSAGGIVRFLRRHPAIVIDALAIVVAALDVTMAVPAGAAPYA